MENVETLESRIQRVTKNVVPEEVLEIECGGCTSTSLNDMFDRFTNLQILNLSDVGLSSLKGFPNLPSLCELELSGNQISGGLELLEGCQKMLVLKLSDNKLGDLDAIKPLAKLEVLRELDLSGCEVCQIENYREKTFDLIKSLIYLDGFDKDNVELAKGEYYKNSENGEGDVVEEDGSDDDEEDDDEEEDDEDEVGLSYLQKSDLGDDDSKDYEAPEDGEDEDDSCEDDEDDIDDEEMKEVISESESAGAGTETGRGKKRKLEEVVETKEK